MVHTLTSWFFALPDSMLIWLSGQPQLTASGGREMDPANQLLLSLLLKQKVLSLDDSKSVPELRTLWEGQLKPFEKASLAGATCRDLYVSGGNQKIRVREFTPESAGEVSPALVYLHGGGFTVFDIETYQGFCEFLAKELNIKIYSVSYRLAPEHPYPAPLDDCCTAFEWVASHAGELGLDPERISIGGDSAGGNMSAALCLRLRDAGSHQPRAQLLIYPSTDLASTFPSVDEFAEGQIITRRHLEWFHSNYVPDPEQMKEPYASPLLAQDHAGLPPAVIITAGFDPLRDEAQAYAEALERAGGQCEHKEMSSLGHGFIVADASKAVREANQTICSMFARVM